MVKNVGQVAGLWIGNSNPQNTKLIWYDTGNSIHKIYDVSTGTWIPVSMNPIVRKTYSELQSLAANNSISQGTFYLITNLGYLALAITTTKIQYTDSNNNVIIDDLISHKTYCVTSENLLIEDMGGVWDVSTNTLKFNFSDTDINAVSSEISENDFVLGTKKRSGVSSFSKYTLKSLVSRVSRNAISWNKGFYLDFFRTLQSYYNQNGGVVRYETYANAIQQITQALTTIQNNFNNLNIWTKTVSSPFTPASTPTDMAVGDTLKNMLQKVQGWINKFKYAKGIVLSSDYQVGDGTAPAAGNTVEEAIGNLQKEVSGLPEDWVPSSDASNPTMQPGDSFPTALSKVQRWFNLFWNITASVFSSKAISRNGNVPVFQFSVSGSAGQQSGQFHITSPDSTTTLSYGGIQASYNDDEYIAFSQGQSRVTTFVPNTMEYNPSNYWTNGESGNVIIDSYTLKVKTPVLPLFQGQTGQNVSFRDLYAIYAESLLSNVRASKMLMINSANYDINEGGTQTYQILNNTPEHIMIYKATTENNEPGMYINLQIQSLRLGQLIGITFVSIVPDAPSSSVNLVSNGNGNGICVPIVNGNLVFNTGATSMTFNNNIEYRFIAIDAYSLGYTGSGLVLWCLNSRGNV